MNIGNSIANNKVAGVSFIETRNKWLAQGKLNGKCKFLGYYQTQEEAIVARGKFNSQHLAPKIRERETFEKHLIELYLSGKSQEEVGKLVGVNASSVCEILKNNDIDARPNKIELNDKLIREMYNDGKTLKYLANFFKVSDGTIKDRLKKQNIEIRPNRKYFLDETMFEKIDTEWKAYFLGLLYADGGVNKLNIVLSLHHKDADVLKKISYIIYGNQEVLKIVPSKKYYSKKANKIYNCSEKCALIINSKKCVNDIIKLGCLQKKSFILKFPSYDIVPKQLFHHFFRGYFDGDGSTWHSKRSNSVVMSIISSNDYCVGFQHYLELEFQMKSYLRAENKVSRITISKREDIIKLYDYMYKDATLYFKRKRDKIDNWMKRLPKV